MKSFCLFLSLYRKKRVLFNWTIIVVVVVVCVFMFMMGRKVWKSNSSLKHTIYVFRLFFFLVSFFVLFLFAKTRSSLVQQKAIISTKKIDIFIIEKCCMISYYIRSFIFLFLIIFLFLKFFWNFCYFVYSWNFSSLFFCHTHVNKSIFLNKFFFFFFWVKIYFYIRHIRCY